MAPKFTKVADGKYRVAIVLGSGKPWSVLVKKQEVLNPSVRGGAYRTQWVAYNGALYVKKVGETRAEAFEAAFAEIQRSSPGTVLAEESQ